MTPSQDRFHHCGWSAPLVSIGMGEGGTALLQFQVVGATL